MSFPLQVVKSVYFGQYPLNYYSYDHIQKFHNVLSSNWDALALSGWEREEEGGEGARGLRNL